MLKYKCGVNMNKKLLIILLSIIIMTSGVVFGAKYTINTSGVVKNQSGQVITSPANTINQNFYSNYSAQTYINNNQVNAEQVDVVEIVMDFSGSMSNWINVAKRSMSAIISQIPNTVKVGFRVFGHDARGQNPTSIHTLQDVKKIVKSGNKYTVITERGPLGITSGACSSTQQVAPIASSNSYAITSGMNSVGLGGATPLVYALDRAVYQDFAGMDMVSPKKIILITDGFENCGGDPCAFAKKLMKQRSDVHIDVVLASTHSQALTCLATTTGGHLYNVNNLSDFTSTITRSIQQKPASQQEIKKQNYEFIGD